MVKYVLVQFLQKTYILTKICCVLLAFILPDLVWFLWHIIKQIFHVFFCLILKLCTLGNIIFNSASRRWILITLWLISDIKQKSMEYLLNIGKRKYLFFTYFFFFLFLRRKQRNLLSGIHCSNVEEFSIKSHCKVSFLAYRRQKRILQQDRWVHWWLHQKNHKRVFWTEDWVIVIQFSGIFLPVII